MFHLLLYHMQALVASYRGMCINDCACSDVLYRWELGLVVCSSFQSIHASFGECLGFRCIMTGLHVRGNTFARHQAMYAVLVYLGTCLKNS